MAVKTKPRAKVKPDRSLEITSLTIGMRDAYYHFPHLLPQRDLALLACKFAQTLFELASDDKEQDPHYSFVTIADNYRAGYKLGSQRCNGMDCKEHKRTLARFYKLEADEGDTGLYLIFGSFKEEIEDLIMVREIKDIDDFSSKLEKGVLVWQSK